MPADSQPGRLVLEVDEEVLRDAEPAFDVEAALRDAAAKAGCEEIRVVRAVKTIPVWKPFERASGEVLCEECRAPLWKHRQPLKQTCPTMVEDCRGHWWKL